MTSRRIALCGVGVAACLTIIAAHRWAIAIPQLGSAPDAIAASPKLSAALTDSAIAESAQTMSENDPFRLSNEPPSVHFDPRAEAGASSTPAIFAPPPMRPTFVLRAIVGGPPWQAVVDGIPGQASGTIVRQGSVFDKITVASVTRDSVLLRGADTSWILTFRRRQ